MTQDLQLAFAPLSDRAQAAASDRALDRISVRDHVVDVEIGAFQAERGATQRVRFNVVVEVAPQADAVDDDVDRILSYDRITEAIEEALAEERLNLLETLADRVAERVLLSSQAMRVFVRIEKLDRGPGALGVEIVRDRPKAPVAEDSKLHPRLVYLSNAALASPLLTGWIDELALLGRPVILCVGASDMPAPQSGHLMTQRRIDLLSIEQNAWVLAARDPRCVVVSTRTELDWAMRHDQMTVWAPSKIVLDAVDGPSVRADDTVALAAWFAADIEAHDLLVIGGAAPAADVPVMTVSAEQATLP